MHPISLCSYPYIIPNLSFCSRTEKKVKNQTTLAPIDYYCMDTKLLEQNILFFLDFYSMVSDLWTPLCIFIPSCQVQTLFCLARPHIPSLCRLCMAIPHLWHACRQNLSTSLLDQYTCLRQFSSDQTSTHWISGSIEQTVIRHHL